MAVRAFELTETPRTRLTVIEGAPPNRRERRRTRRMWFGVCVAGVGLPFVAAIVVVGVTR